MKIQNYLTGRAKDLFDKYFEAIKDKNSQVQISDWDNLAIYCFEMSVYIDCMEMVQEEGAVIEFEQGNQRLEIESPYYKTASKALDNARKAFKEISRWICNIIDQDHYTHDPKEYFKKMM